MFGLDYTNGSVSRSCVHHGVEARDIWKNQPNGTRDVSAKAESRCALLALKGNSQRIRESVSFIDRVFYLGINLVWGKGKVAVVCLIFLFCTSLIFQ